MNQLVKEIRAIKTASSKMLEAASEIESLQGQLDAAVQTLQDIANNPDLSLATTLEIVNRTLAKIRGAAPAAAASVDRRQMLADILCTAFEGGIGYWCLADHATKDAEGNYLALVDCEDAEDPDTKFGDITLDTIKLGMDRILSGAVPIRADLLAQVAQSWAGNEGDCDSYAADCIVQAGLFNEITYG